MNDTKGLSRTYFLFVKCSNVHLAAWRERERERERGREREIESGRKQRKERERGKGGNTIFWCCRYEAERKTFEEERSSWQDELAVAKQEILEQNDRLTLLSQQLAGTKASALQYLYTHLLFYFSRRLWR